MDPNSSQLPLSLHPGMPTSTASQNAYPSPALNARGASGSDDSYEGSLFQHDATNGRFMGSHHDESYHDGDGDATENMDIDPFTGIHTDVGTIQLDEELALHDRKSKRSRIKRKGSFVGGFLKLLPRLLRRGKRQVVQPTSFDFRETIPPSIHLQYSRDGTTQTRVVIGEEEPSDPPFMPFTNSGSDAMLGIGDEINDRSHAPELMYDTRRNASQRSYQNRHNSRDQAASQSVREQDGEAAVLYHSASDQDQVISTARTSLVPSGPTAPPPPPPSVIKVPSSHLSDDISDISSPISHMMIMLRAFRDISHLPWVSSRVAEDYIPDISSARSKYRPANRVRRVADGMAEDGESWYRPSIQQLQRLHGKHRRPYNPPKHSTSRSPGRSVAYMYGQGYVAPQQTRAVAHETTGSHNGSLSLHNITMSPATATTSPPFQYSYAYPAQPIYMIPQGFSHANNGNNYNGTRVAGTQVPSRPASIVSRASRATATPVNNQNGNANRNNAQVPPQPMYMVPAFPPPYVPSPMAFSPPSVPMTYQPGWMNMTAHPPRGQ